MLEVPQITRLPAVVDALVAAFAGIASDDDYGPLVVLDGPDESAREVRNVIVVGNGEPAISHTLISEGRGAAYDESFDIAFLTWAWSGAPMKQHRDRCVTVLTAMRAIVDAQPLSNVWLQLGDSFEWTNSTSGAAKSVALQGTIHAVASI